MLLRVADFFFVLRPLILIPAWSFYALGVHFARPPARVELFSVVTQPGFWCLTGVLACAYVLNQVFDVDSDRLNDKGHYLTRGLFRVRTLVLIALVCFVAAAWLRQSAEPAQRPLLLVALLLSLVYSLPPLRLVARPWADLVANAVGYGGLAFVIGYAAVSRTLLPAWLDALPWVLLVAATFLHTTILDVDGDAAGGKRTTTVAIGVRSSARLAMIFALWAAANQLWMFLRKEGPLLPALVTGAACIAFTVAYVAIARSDRPGANAHATRTRASSAAVQIATAVVAIGAAIRDPFLLVLFVPVLVAARFYYRARFGTSYPGWGAKPSPAPTTD